MTTMANHSSATAHEPHVTNTIGTTAISDALRRRALALISDRSIRAQERVLIRYGLEINDPCLAELVRRVDAGESIVDNLDVSESADNESIEEKIGTLASIICRSGDEPEEKSAALFVLMGTLEHSSNPRLLANAIKHVAFSRCGELNLYGMVDAQISIVEGELLASGALAP